MTATILARVTGIRPGDYVRVDIPSERDLAPRMVLRRVRSVDKSSPGGPWFELENESEPWPIRYIAPPASEIERRLWAIEPGDEIAYWCEPRRDRRGRVLPVLWHTPGIRCHGNTWHVAGVEDVNREGSYSGQVPPVLRVEGFTGLPNPQFCDVDLFEGMLRFRWKRDDLD